jgi:hypothetical protein
LTSFPVQSAGAPETVSVNVSQFVPSMQVVSPSGDTPPGAVPSQVTDEPTVGLMVPDAGLAARTLDNEAKSTAARMKAASLFKEKKKCCLQLPVSLVFISFIPRLFNFLLMSANFHSRRRMSAVLF